MGTHSMAFNEASPTGTVPSERHPYVRITSVHVLDWVDMNLIIGTTGERDHVDSEKARAKLSIAVRSILLWKV